MVLEPGVAEDHALLPKIGDSEEHPLRVGLIMEIYVYYFGDLPCFVRGAIHVEYRYRVSIRATGAQDSRRILS